jgi:spermidine synthase
MRPAALLFLSGAAALVYQTLWVKQLGLVVGVDVYGVTIAVGAFFAGLALGGPVFGARADRSPRPFALCAALELGIALLGIGATLVLGRAAPIYIALRASIGAAAWAFPFLLIGLPAFLMGGTLPVLVRAWRPGEGATARASGNLYAANTLGAIAGTLATPFLLIPAFGMRGTALAAGACNVLVAALAAASSRPRRSPDVVPLPAEPLTADARTALVFYAVAGGVALGYEVVWTQAIAQLIGTRAYAFAIVLATYLSGLALGSALYARLADRVRRPWSVFGLLIAGAGASALVILAGLGGWLPRMSNSFGIRSCTNCSCQTSKPCPRCSAKTSFQRL